MATKNTLFSHCPTVFSIQYLLLLFLPCISLIYMKTNISLKFIQCSWLNYRNVHSVAPSEESSRSGTPTTSWLVAESLLELGKRKKKRWNAPTINFVLCLVYPHLLEKRIHEQLLLQSQDQWQIIGYNISRISFWCNRKQLVLIRLVAFWIFHCLS